MDWLMLIAVPLCGLFAGLEGWKKQYLRSQGFSDLKAVSRGLIRHCNESREIFIEAKDVIDKLFETNSYTYDCSLPVLRAASENPFDYFIKYFNLDLTEETLEGFECLSKYIDIANQGIELYQYNFDALWDVIKDQVPWPIRVIYKHQLIDALGIYPLDLSESYFPAFHFLYESPGGKSSSRFSLVFDLSTTEQFLDYLGKRIEWYNSAKGQRALMTSKLREEIKKRDNYTCQHCGNSIYNEPNLLLEVDHIVPVSRGGKTEPENLQTLCWRCNRSKGAKTFD